MIVSRIQNNLIICGALSHVLGIQFSNRVQSNFYSEGCHITAVLDFFLLYACRKWHTDFCILWNFIICNFLGVIEWNRSHENKENHPEDDLQANTIFVFFIFNIHLRFFTFHFYLHTKFTQAFLFPDNEVLSANWHS